ncbi:FHIP family protein GJ17503 isoform X2 [Condylostylus longicornis]|uniref:FHIP family protein GJ17503 isoform X2 n=1 Tax=Condylostylus longicornis TaxID=2530218 RepID=UPI00244E22A2|nr:FHIP family protein GJ17503 isoform X2 [Condylostylus longicornis]
MSWLRGSPLRQSLTRGSNNTSNSGSGGRQISIDTASNCDPRACYDSFCKHWQQAHEIILKAENKKPAAHDDVLGVVSHLDYMVTLLLVELHHVHKISLPTPNQTPPPAPCLEYLLSENLLDKLYEWGITTGGYANAVRLEQLKLYELLLSYSKHQLLCHEPFLRPLLKMLASSQGEIFPPDVEKRLVILLNQLCVVLMQNVPLLDLFFFSSNQHGQGQNSTNFIIFSLLIPFVHREGSIGHQARDALLLCMSLSQKNANVGTYIAQYSSMCPLLVTGLGGLYSRLPNTLEINAIDWHRITPDDVTEIPELTLFMNSLEFCNAVVQVAHDLIKQQLLDFMYQGFIVPVLGPSILQIFKGNLLQTNVESQISAMSYLDLILRSVTEPGLLKAFVRFLLDEEKFDGQRILDVLVDRLYATDPNLCMVTLSLFDTLIGLYCEDLMLELLLKFLLPGKHVPISCRHKINKIDCYASTVDFFLELTPDVMKHSTNFKKLHQRSISNINIASQAQQQQPYIKQENSIQSQSYNFNIATAPSLTVSKTIGANWNHYGLYSGDNSLYSNFHAYLLDAHYKIAQCRSGCLDWSNQYKYQKWPPRRGSAQQQHMEKMIEMVKTFFTEFGSNVCPNIMQSATNVNNETQIFECDKSKYDSLQSIGESSGYESFKYKPDDETDMTNTANNVSMGNIHSDVEDNGAKSRSCETPVWKISSKKDVSLLDLDFSEDLFAQGTATLGPFINAVWRKLETFTSNSFYVNLHLTGLITRLACFPLPLIHSLLLRPDIVTTSDAPSFHQVLRILKQQIDAELPPTEDSLEIIDVARSWLIDREFRLIYARKSAVESSKNPGRNGLPYNQTTYANISSTTPPQLTPSSSYDPFKRTDSKRRSFSKSISNIFGKKSIASSGLSQKFMQFFTGSSTNQNISSNNAVSNNVSTTSFTNTPSMSSHSSSNTITLQDIPSSSSSLSQSAQSCSQTTLNSDNSSIINSNNNNSGSSSINSTLCGGGNSGPNSLDSIGVIGNTSGTERTRDLSLCAVLLDEWLKELAAISQEQSVVMLSDTL